MVNLPLRGIPSDRHTLDPASRAHHAAAAQHHSGSSWPDKPHKLSQETLAAVVAKTQRVPAVDSAVTVAEEALLQQVAEVLASVTPLWRHSFGAQGDQPHISEV